MYFVQQSLGPEGGQEFILLPFDHISTANWRASSGRKRRPRISLFEFGKIKSSLELLLVGIAVKQNFEPIEFLPGKCKSTSVHSGISMVEHCAVWVQSVPFIAMIATCKRFKISEW